MSIKTKFEQLFGRRNKAKNIKQDEDTNSSEKYANLLKHIEKNETSTSDQAMLNDKIFR